VEDLARREAAVSKREQELQGREEDISRKLEHEHSELKSLTDDLHDREASQVAEKERLRKMREDLLTHDLAVSLQEGSVEHRTTELATREKQLAERDL
jgi:hypothetical protein